MLRRKRAVLVVSLPFIFFVAIAFPTISKMAEMSGAAGRSSAPSGTSARGNRLSLALPHPAAAARRAGTDEQVQDALSLNVARRNHTATALPDGRVIIIGGDNLAGAVREAEILDPSTHTVLVLSMLQTPRTQHAATLLPDGRVLVTGGAGQAGLLDSSEIFDPQRGSFSPGPRLKLARAGHTATVLDDGRVLVAGGSNDGTAELFDPASNRFTLTEGRMAAQRRGHSAILLGDGNVLLAGGQKNAEHNMESAEVFDAGTLAFSPTAEPMILPRARPALRLLHDGKVQVVGGDYDGSMEVYDPVTRSFGAAAHLVPTADLFSKREILSAQTRAGFIDSITYRALKEERRLPEQLKERITAFENGSIGRSQYATAEIEGLDQAVVVGGLDDNRYLTRSAVLVRSSSASLTTDKVKYLPGEAPMITGAGFAPFERVTIVRQEARIGRKRKIFEATANEQGIFMSGYLRPSDYQVWTTYTLTARGTASEQVAQTSYQDAPPPGQEWDTIPKHFQFRAPISSKDLSVESETVLYKLTARSDKAADGGSVTSADAGAIRGDSSGSGADAGARASVNAAAVTPATETPACGTAPTTPVTCSDPAPGGFGFNTPLPTGQCLGIPGNPCSVFGDLQFVDNCISFQGMFNFNSCLADKNNNNKNDCDLIDPMAPPLLSFSVDENFKAHVVLQ